jgi:hypothetical protein
MNFVRRAFPDDLPWMIETAVKKYPEFDQLAAWSWGQEWVNKDEMLFIRTQNVWLIAGEVRRFYAPSRKEAAVVFLCSERDDRKSAWECVALFRALLKWATHRGCYRVDTTAEPGQDFGPFVRRACRGMAVTEQINYMIKLQNRHIEARAGTG